MDIRLKMWTKNSQANGFLRENVSVFLIEPSCYNKQKCRYEGHLRKEIVLLKYQVFRFGTKSGGQFELLNLLEKSTRLLMLEDYDLVHFTIR